MRIVVDLQACQSPDGRIRGVGRYCLSLSLALARNSRGHEVWIALNGAMPESVGTVRDLFAGVVPAERIVSWEGLAPTASINPENASRGLVAEHLRELFLEGLNADVVLTASMVDGFVDSVVTSVPKHSSSLQVAILFDLIPLIMPDIYLALEGQSPWYMRKVDHLSHCDLLLGISDSACGEAVRMLGVDRDRVVNISAAVSADFCRSSTALSASAVGAKYGVNKSFVMYAGGFDPRKNLERLVEGYAALGQEVRKGHQLVMVGNIAPKELNELTAAREKFGLGPDELVFTGFVSDAELIRLYNACALYVFPSTHEGFGLPALEAMSCGAVVIGANATSLPEVIGMDDALFDPEDVRDMTRKLTEGLTDDAFRTRMLEHATRQVKKFSWTASAEHAWEAIESAIEKKSSRVRSADDRPVAPASVRNDRVALLVAQPPSEATLATVSRLSPARVDVFGDVPGSDSSSLPSGWTARAFPGFDAASFDTVVVNVLDAAKVATLLLAVRGLPATLTLESEHVPAVFEELASHDPTFLAGMLYRWGGYRALDVLGETSLERFDDLPSSILAYGDAAWREGLHAPSAGGHAIDAIVDLPGVREWPPAEIGRLAMAIAANAPNRSPLRTLFVDISHLVIEDAKTGIQRVVRHIVAELLASPPLGFRVEPVYIQPDGVFRYARSYCVNRFHPGITLPADLPVAFQPGDTFVGLDLAAHLVPYLRDTYVRMRSRGVEIHFVVYDLLPLLRPDCFDQNGLPTFRLWYEAISELSDGIICISRTVADEFKQWLPQSMPVRGRPLRLGWFHLGADLVPTADAADISGVLPFDLKGRPTFLMVGTIEPRKGHAQTLAAFELLWAAGHDINLVLIGKPGWRVESLVASLRSHVESGERLLWMERADDTQLIAMYQEASALLAPSEGEGFGLPLIEAAQYGRPIIARDLPVFKEVAGEHAFYFSGVRPEAMAAAIDEWLGLFARGEAPASTGLPWLTWRKSARQLAEVAVEGRWYDAWMPGSIRHFVASDYRAEASTGELRRGQRFSAQAPGLLYATPPFEMSAGSYEVRVVGERAGSEGSAWVDVEAHGGSWRLASELLTAGEGTIALVQVRLAEDVRDLRVRLMVDRDADVTFTSVEISPAA
jgi:glycosyltransferase involved in cell wall biosynthesis